ncbi:MAG: hypothetical protein H7Z76_11405 [Methylotenera sp.]|nr:hypothetical protein [Flavobacterium sp.]
MKEQIIKAIENRNLLQFYYDENLRIVEPHTFGFSKKGNDILSAYQIDGKSDKGYVPDWKLFTISKILTLKTLERTFEGEREGYNTDDSRMITIYAEL